MLHNCCHVLIIVWSMWVLHVGCIQLPDVTCCIWLVNCMCKSVYCLHAGSFCDGVLLACTISIEFYGWCNRLWMSVYNFGSRCVALLLYGMSCTEGLVCSFLLYVYYVFLRLLRRQGCSYSSAKHVTGIVGGVTFKGLALALYFAITWVTYGVLYSVKQLPCTRCNTWTYHIFMYCVEKYPVFVSS